MDPTNNSSPRRQLQGPRPPPLRVSKDSVKIKKPPPHPAGPQPHATTSVDPAPYASGAPRRRPVIIYDASPKVIHTKPGDFMSLVQRLTGHNSEAGPSATSPAARLATIEKSVSPSPRPNRNQTIDIIDDILDGIGISYSMGTDRGFVPQSEPGPSLIGQVPPGILSPMPSSLLPVSPGFFSPMSFDPSCLTILNDLSPVFNCPASNNNFVGSGVTGNYSCSTPFSFSPSALLATPAGIPSPGFTSELLNMLDF